MTIRLTGGNLRGLTLFARAPPGTRKPFRNAGPNGGQGPGQEPDLVIRPTSALFRRSLFDVLAARGHPPLVGARFADICAGSGAVGIEALSRGAASCCFVDLPFHRTVLEGNLARALTAAQGRSRAEDQPGEHPDGKLGSIELQWRTALAFRGGRHGPLTHVFADPPYRAPRPARPEETEATEGLNEAARREPRNRRSPEPFPSSSPSPVRIRGYAHPGPRRAPPANEFLAQRLLDHLAALASATDGFGFLVEGGLILMQRAPRQRLVTPPGLAITDERRQGNAVLVAFARA